MRIGFRRIPRRRLGEALLVAALLLAALAATLRFFVIPSGSVAGAGTAGLTPAAGSGGAAGQNAAGAGTGSPGVATGQPAHRSGSPAHTSGAATALPPVHVAGAAALPSARVHAGYDTPEDAVDGFYLALLSGTPTRACAYVDDSCPSFASGRITGLVTILDAMSHGGEALVEVSGTICVAASCVLLTDRVAMPTGPASFAASWTRLISGVYGWAGSPLPCVQDPATRRWHVKLA
jgi:hypothetical protein